MSTVDDNYMKFNSLSWSFCVEISTDKHGRGWKLYNNSQAICLVNKYFFKDGYLSKRWLQIAPESFTESVFELKTVWNGVVDCLPPSLPHPISNPPPFQNNTEKKCWGWREKRHNRELCAFSRFFGQDRNEVKNSQQSQGENQRVGSPTHMTLMNGMILKTLTRARAIMGETNRFCWFIALIQQRGGQALGGTECAPPSELAGEEIPGLLQTVAPPIPPCPYGWSLSKGDDQRCWNITRSLVMYIHFIVQSYNVFPPPKGSGCEKKFHMLKRTHRV